jgi:hypothetical protein
MEPVYNSLKALRPQTNTSRRYFKMAKKQEFGGIYSKSLVMKERWKKTRLGRSNRSGKIFGKSTVSLRQNFLWLGLSNKILTWDKS